MRALLATAFLLAGCLHAQGPGARAAKADPATLHAFELLVNDADTIDDAAAFAEAKGLRREDTAGIAERAYWSFMRAEIYVPAAEIAWRFRFGETAVKMAFDLQRKAARKAYAEYETRKLAPQSSGWMHHAIHTMAREIRIACRYGPTAEVKQAAIKDAVWLKTAVSASSALDPLLDEGCPVTPELRDQIIDAAVMWDRDDFAIRHGASAGWDVIRVSQFLDHYFGAGDCTNGMKALVAFPVTEAQAANVIEHAKCETEIIDARAWKVPQASADSWFFAAARGGKWNLALEILPLTSHGENGKVFLWESVLRARGEIQMMKVLPMHPGCHDGFMASLWDAGRFRFIANFAQSYDWQKKAFDKLLEIGKWEDAAEAAEYGFGESFRAEGVKIAFRAAMAAGAFKVGRYFVHRYGPVKDKPGLVTQQMYDEEKDKFYASKQGTGDPEWMKERKSEVKEAKVKRKGRKRRKPPCPDGDWCP